MSQDFRQSLVDKANEEKKLGKLIIISGMSGAGKNITADILVDNLNYAFINKYVTRPFRENEIAEVNNGKSIGIKPVRGNYNDGEKDVEVQKNFAIARKQAFLNLRLPLSYINYDNYYGFSIEEINNYIKNGRNAVVIVNDIGLVRDLKDIYEENCLSCYVHRANPKNKDIFMEIANQRGDTPESAEKRYQKAIKDFDRYTNNITLYDYTILNTENDTQKLSQMLKDLDVKDFKKIQKEKTAKQGNAKIYVFIGNPGSGKDEALETIRVQGVLHSIIMPKHTTRARKEDDGEEMICPEDEKFDINSCDLQYTNYGSTYGINTQELHERLKNGISSGLVVSNREALEKLKEEFPNELVTIYIHGLSKEEYSIQQKDHLDDEYVKKRLEEYEQANELYYNQWLDFNHVLINNGDSTDLKLQIDNIIRYYEGGRNLSMDKLDNYLSQVRKCMDKFARTENIKNHTKG